MKTPQIFACLLLACVVFFSGERRLHAQVQPGPAAPLVLPNPSVKSTTSAAPAATLSPLTAVDPFVLTAGVTRSASPATGKPSAPGASKDPCSSILPDHSSIIIEPDPLGVAPGGGADQLSEPSPSIRSKNPAIMACEGGRILVKVASKRFYGYHLGDELPISIEIVADDGVQLNFDSLNQQIIGFNGSDFQLIPVRAVSVASRPYPGRPHSTLYGIELSVQTFVTKPTVVFNLDLKYALDVPPGVKQPNWRILTTPDFVVTNSPVITTVSDDEVDDGDLTPADFRSSWIQWPLMISGLFLIVWFSFLRRLIIRLNKLRPGRVVPPEEVAWSVFNKVFNDARIYDEFNTSYLRNVEGALRAYLAQSSGMKIQSLSIQEISSLMEDDPRLPTLVSALKKCESVIYARIDQPVKLTEEQIRELYDELQTLVPFEDD
jgi:hypothetical protein